jgi:hypothetical protein
VERWIDLRSEGWYSGDCHAIDITPHAALLEGAAEDLSVVNLLAYQAADGSYPNLLAFSGQHTCLERDGHLVVVGTLNQHRRLGNIAMLNCHRIVYPLTISNDEWSMVDWCDQCHRKHGLVVGCDGARVTSDAGKIDAVQLGPLVRSQPSFWKSLYDAIGRITLVGGSGKSSPSVPLGALRTYARLSEGVPFSYSAWIEAVRARRTFVTAQPILRLTVDGRQPGETVVVAPNTLVHIHAIAEAADSVPQVEIIANGQILGEGRRSIELEHRVPTDGWIAARCVNPGDGVLLAHTSAVLVAATER